MPNQELIYEWVAALRSGRYEQVKSKLRTEHGYCCLGVACELAVERGIIGSPMKSRSDEYKFVHDEPPHTFQFAYLGEFGTMPSAVRVWLGIDPSTYAPTGRINLSFRDRSNDTLTLTGLNDSGFTFDQIADVIEYEYS